MKELKQKVMKVRKLRRLITELHQYKEYCKTLNQKEQVNGAIEMITSTVKAISKATEFLCKSCGCVVKLAKCSGCKKDYLKNG